MTTAPRTQLSGAVGRDLRRPARRSRPTVTGLGFLAPFLIIYAVFLLYPVVQAFYMSGFNWDLLSSTHRWVGIDNFTRMLWGRGITWDLVNLWPLRLALLAAGAWLLTRTRTQPKGRVGLAALAATATVLALLLGFHPGPDGAWNDATFWTALRNTVVFTVISTPLLIALGLLMALCLNAARRGTGIYRAAFFLPYVLPISAVTLIWSYLLNPERGLVAGFLGWFGIPGVPFLSDPNLAMPAIIATTLWWSVGFNMVLFLAGLQDIEPSLYEAASLDGATYWQRFQHITVPGLRHVTILVAITQVIASFQIFGQVYIMTKGGPGTATQVLIQNIYETGFKKYQLGYAAALSVFLFIVMAAVSAIQFRLTPKDV